MCRCIDECHGQDIDAQVGATWIRMRQLCSCVLLSYLAIKAIKATPSHHPQDDKHKGHLVVRFHAPTFSLPSLLHPGATGLMNEQDRRGPLICCWLVITLLTQPLTIHHTTHTQHIDLLLPLVHDPSPAAPLLISQQNAPFAQPSSFAFQSPGPHGFARHCCCSSVHLFVP